MGHRTELGDVIPLVVSRRNMPKAPTILRYILQYIANSGLIYIRRATQNKQITTSKDKMKDCQLDDEINFVLLQKWCYMSANKIYKVTYPWDLNWIVTNHIPLYAK